MSVEDDKRAVGERAAALVEPGMAVGLGTGSTAFFFVEALGRRVADGLKTVGVPTSRATRDQAARLRIPLATLDDMPTLDLTVDGADEIGPDLALIKGGGGALLREKLVAAASRRMIVVADAAKRVERLGRFPLPVEVVPFGAESTLRRIGALLGELGLPDMIAIRTRDGRPVVTDNGNMVADLHLGAIADPALLAARLKAVLGVVEHGLFIGLADGALIGSAGEVMEIAGPDHARSSGDP